jgi:hypothetical protein
MAMKKLCLTAVIVASLLVCSIGIQAQTTQTQLNQLKLAKAFFVGSWLASVGKDTIDAWNCEQYGNAFVINVYIVINGKKSFSYIEDFGYSSKDSKFRGFILYQSGTYITWIGTFASEKMFSGNYVRNFNPEAVVGKFEIVMKTPTSLTINNFNLDGVKTGEYKWTKIK